jgi:hypothetical protein
MFLIKNNNKKLKNNFFKDQFIFSNYVSFLFLYLYFSPHFFLLFFLFMMVTEGEEYERENEHDQEDLQ